MQRLNLLFPYILFGAITLVVVLANVPDNTLSVVEAQAQTPMCLGCGADVNADDALTEVVDDKTYYFCGPCCHDAIAEKIHAKEPQATADDVQHFDVVCSMEVNPAWGFASQYRNQTYRFCTQRCKEEFDADPQSYLSEKCVVCATGLAGQPIYTATYLSKQYHLCSAEHREWFKADPAAYFMHTMWGIPTWLYYVSIAGVLVVSFGVFDWIGRRHSGAVVKRQAPGYPPGAGQGASATMRRVLSNAFRATAPVGTGAVALPVSNVPAIAGKLTPAADTPGGDRFDLLSLSWIRAALHSRRFRFGLQATFVALFLMVIAAGLFGNQNPALNIAPLLTWTVWWGLLPVLILFAAKAWCYACPWDALAGWTEKLKLWKKTDTGLSMNWRWPRVVRNISIATILFIGLTWVELGFGVTMKPQVTAYLAIGMLLLAVISALLFDKKSFCRYGCLVGRVSGLYALFAGAEVRAKSHKTCSACRGKECVSGSQEAYGCPTFLYPGNMQTNTYCIQCMECLQACPEDNLAVNLRPWGSDLALEGKPRTDEAYLALLMLSITGFHGLTMTPAWQQLVDWIRSSVDLGRVVGFTAGMALIMIAPVAIYAVLVAVSHRLGRKDALKPLAYRDYFIRYAYALLPIALFYHIAHNLEHLLMEGPKVLAMLSDPFGWNWNLFGTAGWNVPPLVSLSHLWLIQVFLVLVGHVYSLWVAQRTSLRLFGTSKAALKSQVPMLAGMICFSVFSLWLLKQPMEMRTSAM